jgi:hypothetical protein
MTLICGRLSFLIDIEIIAELITAWHRTAETLSSGLLMTQKDS